MSAPPGARAADITVMTQNLYIGTDTDALVNAAAVAFAGGPVGPYVTELFAARDSVIANDFPTRAKAIAQEINLNAPPLLIGLQEAYKLTLPEPLDYTETFIAALADRGLNYAVVAGGTHQGFTFTDPTFGIGATDYDVVLALQVTGFVTSGHDTPFVDQGENALFPLTNGFVSVDASLNGLSFTFVSTHMDPTGNNNQAQIQQILDSLNGSSDPQFVVGDFNTEDIQLMLDNGFVDTAAAMGVDDPTFGQDADLSNPLSKLTDRIDYIFARNFDSVLSAVVIGATPFQDARPLWPSDHAGLIASVAPVPIPAALPLLMSGLGGVGLMGWWRRRRRVVGF